MGHNKELYVLFLFLLLRVNTDDEEEMLYGDSESSDVFFANTSTEYQPPKK